MFADIAHATRRWLIENNIDPSRVHVVLRAKDDQTLQQMVGALQSDRIKAAVNGAGFSQLPAPANPVRSSLLAGLKITLSSLDTR